MGRGLLARFFEVPWLSTGSAEDSVPSADKMALGGSPSAAALRGFNSVKA